MSGPPPALLAWRLRQAGCLPGLAAAAPDLPGARAVDGDLWAGDPPRHRRHACLVARIFLSLEPVLWSWSRIPPAPGGPAPDARARLLPCAAEVWLEADTGSESRRQWLAKLERYHLWAPGPLVAVAEDPRRVARLAAWLAAGPAPDPWPAGAFPLADLARTLPAWLAAHARPDPPPHPQPPSAATGTTGRSP
ncbi:protein of unknown function [Candidatus Hydrogenisulfobacillus filiaventi]|uniref:Uncharacterized protein n=1 Tax=Candidatus Hydrogenisulfobacillus filiaventi TaxID=2707344 RepID=A0A6F8ZEC3_9FIRM|nr:protein of unknown function [Candidatus Hydrogenisulfobacillus filiaventi]